MNCIFCKIINKEIPSYKIYEDEYTYAFLDIAKDVDGHTLVIPKKHVVNVLDCDVETLNHVMNTIKKICNHYVTNCGYEGCNIINASGKEAQQSVFHLHFHIIPRKKDDGVNAWPDFKGATNELEAMHNLLKLQDK